MNEVDRKYDEWLNEIKVKQPVLVNPDQLTADILQRVSVLKRPKKSKRLSKRFYLFGSWLSGIAAIVLFCFLLAETMRMPLHPECETSRFIRESVPASALPSNWKLMTLAEKRSYLSACHKQQELQKQLVYKNIEKKLLKTMPYENK